MGISLPKVGHPHKCPECQAEWIHKTYACTAAEEMRCPDHEQP